MESKWGRDNLYPIGNTQCGGPNQSTYILEVLQNVSHTKQQKSYFC